MNSLLKWTESQLEKIDDIGSKALNIKKDPENDLILDLQSQNSKLREDLRNLKSISNTQLKDCQDKSQVHIDLLKTTVQSLENSLKQLTEENTLLKEHLRNADMKLTRLAKVNEELSVNIENDLNIPESNYNIEEFQHQINLLTEKVKRQNMLLKVEKLKTIDALREKTEIQELYELEKKSFKGKMEALRSEVNTEKECNVKLKELLEAKPKLSLNSDSQNLAALSEHLQVKQRTIESLINEKSSLILKLENEVNGI
jgi:hypothetical protein